MFQKKIIILLLSLVQVFAQNSGTTVLGIGYGSFIIIASVLLALVIIILSRSTSQPELYSFIALLLPVFFILLFVFLPKQSQQSTVSSITDSNYIPHIIFTVLFLLMFLLSLGLYLGDIIFVYKKAKNIARTGVITISKKQESQISQKQVKSQAGSQNNLLQQQNQISG